MFGGERRYMPITDATKKQIAQQRRLFFKVCFKCGGRIQYLQTVAGNAEVARLRLKNRTLGAKK